MTYPIRGPRAGTQGQYEDPENRRGHGNYSRIRCDTGAVSDAIQARSRYSTSCAASQFIPFDDGWREDLLPSSASGLRPSSAPDSWHRRMASGSFRRIVRSICLVDPQSSGSESFSRRPLHVKKAGRYWTTRVSFGDRAVGVESMDGIVGCRWRYRPNRIGESARPGSLCDPDPYRFSGMVSRIPPMTSCGLKSFFGLLGCALWQLIHD